MENVSYSKQCNQDRKHSESFLSVPLPDIINHRVDFPLVTHWHFKYGTCLFHAVCSCYAYVAVYFSAIAGS